MSNIESSAPREPDVGATATPVTLDLMRLQLERIDGEIIDLVGRRIMLARQLHDVRHQLGGTRFVLNDDVSVLRRFRQVAGGIELATILLRLGR
jgi:chorismate mutase